MSLPPRDGVSEFTDATLMMWPLRWLGIRRAVSFGPVITT
ncbi:MAG: hypothetical protein QOD90_3762 [Mycobacterium sp.]|jgi:hypothetical protein|nr:hypothetical protein [Mycobacterium sp.]